MNDEIEKRGAGRPSGSFKMERWIKALTDVLSEEDIIFLSDKDLVFLVNRNLSPEEKISKSTFEKWKAGKFAPDDTLAKEFIECIEFSLIKQKQLLSKKMMEDTTGQWTRYAWIMERKFSEWNLKHISENINKNEQATVINITAGNEEQKSLLDSIINNTEFIEVKPKQIQQNNNENEDEIGF